MNNNNLKLALSMVVSWIILSLNIAGLFLQISPNVHKGMLDKPGDFWYGYDLVFSGSLFIIGLPYLIGLLLEIMAAFTCKISKIQIIWFSWTWLVLAIIFTWAYFMNEGNIVLWGYYFIGIPPIIFIVPIAYRFNISEKIRLTKH